ncbi:MAG: aspartyl protease family protein [Candidatus Omnitrophota bacterium]|nr:aspartyl protease family protein [Candidatus Omnitrophota bacterium]
MKLPYKKFVVQSRPSGPASVVTRPVIPIHVASQQRVAYEALVDSGADYSIFHAQIGEAIGLEVRKGQRVLFAGVGGVARKGFVIR